MRKNKQIERRDDSMGTSGPLAPIPADGAALRVYILSGTRRDFICRRQDIGPEHSLAGNPELVVAWAGTR